MSLYTYIAENNPQEANNLLTTYGYKITDSYRELISRLKEIVRVHKKVALQDLVKIHPDKSLFKAFEETNFTEKEFAYATGRTPGFAEPIVEPESNFEEVDNTNTKEVLDQIKEVKEQIKRNRGRKRTNGNVVSTAGLGQSQLLMIGVAFAIGYIIGKK
tara:strand:- start:744 stop:1220 length:477 start_codon:yes stop_codon:yes gene_type:complete